MSKEEIMWKVMLWTFFVVFPNILFSIIGFTMEDIYFYLVLGCWNCIIILCVFYNWYMELK